MSKNWLHVVVAVVVVVSGEKRPIATIAMPVETKRKSKKQDDSEEEPPKKKTVTKKKEVEKSTKKNDSKSKRRESPEVSKKKVVSKEKEETPKKKESDRTKGKDREHSRDRDRGRERRSRSRRRDDRDRGRDRDRREDHREDRGRDRDRDRGREGRNHEGREGRNHDSGRHGEDRPDRRYAADTNRAVLRARDEEGKGGGKGKGWGSWGSRDFNSRDEKGKGKGRPEWNPGSGRNLDLEAEKSGGRGRMQWYSDHDDRQEGGGQRRRGGSPDNWKHDMFEEISKPADSKKEDVQAESDEEKNKKSKAKEEKEEEEADDPSESDDWGFTLEPTSGAAEATVDVFSSNNEASQNTAQIIRQWTGGSINSVIWLRVSAVVPKVYNKRSGILRTALTRGDGKRGQKNKNPFFQFGGQLVPWYEIPMDTPSQWFSPWLFLQITVAHTCFNLYIFRNGFIGYSQCFFSENLHRFSHDGLLGSGRYTSSMGTVPWCRMGCFVRVVSMPLPISCWMRCGLVCVWVGGGPKIHRGPMEGLLLVLDPIQKHLYTCIICIWYLEWFLDSSAIFSQILT